MTEKLVSKSNKLMVTAIQELDATTAKVEKAIHVLESVITEALNKKDDLTAQIEELDEKVAETKELMQSHKELATKLNELKNR